MVAFKPLSPLFGIETSDVDLAALTDAQFRELEQAFYAHQVLAVRAQTLAPAQFAAFARRFGPPQPHVIDQFHHPDDPNILILSNVKRDGQPIGLQDAGSYFHTDYSYLQVPARATTLYSLEVPQVGGDTLFANQIAAYEDLPDAMKQLIEPLYAIHHYGNQLRFRYGVGDVVVWDNAALLHSATLTDPAYARTLWRITVLEESAQAAAPEVLAPSLSGQHAGGRATRPS